MFGLSKREQRWRAEKEAGMVLAALCSEAIRANAEIRIAEAEAETARLRAGMARLQSAAASIGLEVPK